MRWLAKNFDSARKSFAIGSIFLQMDFINVSDCLLLGYFNPLNRSLNNSDNFFCGRSFPILDLRTVNKRVYCLIHTLKNELEPIRIIQRSVHYILKNIRELEQTEAEE